MVIPTVEAGLQRGTLVMRSAKSSLTTFDILFKNKADQFIGAVCRVKRWPRLLRSNHFAPLQLGKESDLIQDKAGTLAQRAS